MRLFFRPVDGQLSHHLRSRRIGLLLLAAPVVRRVLQRAAGHRRPSARLATHLTSPFASLPHPTAHASGCAPTPPPDCRYGICFS